MLFRLLPLRPAQGPHQAPLLLEVGVDRATGSHQQRLALLVRELREQRAVHHHRLEDLERLAQRLRPGRVARAAARLRAAVVSHPESLDNSGRTRDPARTAHPWRTIYRYS